MAFQGAIPIEFGAVFPDGAYAAGVFEAVRDFDRSQGDRFVQQVDKGTGLPVWAVDVIDADAAGTRAHGQGEGGGGVSADAAARFGRVTVRGGGVRRPDGDPVRGPREGGQGQDQARAAGLLLQGDRGPGALTGCGASRC